MRPTAIDMDIYRTVAWFSVFGYPVTAFEVWKWLYAPSSEHALADVFQALAESPWLAAELQRHQGCFAVLSAPPIAQLCDTRHDRFLDAVRKFAKVRRAAALFARVPSVRAVAVGNTLSWWHTRPESDIDLFIVTQPGTIWATRALLVFPFALLGKRPSATKEPRVDTFCFSFFVTQDALQMQPLALEGEDPYLAYWTKALVPLFDREEVFSRMGEENPWVDSLLPHARLRRSHKELRARAGITFPFPLRPAESSLRHLQRRRFPERIREGANQDSRVVVSDAVLKFHANDRREKFRTEWREMVSNTYDA